MAIYRKDRKRVYSSLAIWRFPAKNCGNLGKFQKTSILVCGNLGKRRNKGPAANELRVFCDETVAAFQTHPKLNPVDVAGTTDFIKIFIKFWKLFNVKGIGTDGRYNDSLRAVLRSSDEPRLKFLLDLGHMADKMKKSGKNRVHELTSDTSYLQFIC